MAYKFKGRLCGWLCLECQEALSDATVRIYRSRKDQNVTALAVANPKDTFRILSDEDVAAKSASLVAEAKTDTDGNFTFDLDEKAQSYLGEAFEIDVYCGTVPHLPPMPRPPRPRQFSITTLRPMWKQEERGFFAGWDYCIPQRYWCAFRAMFGAWTICGHVKVCDTGQPVGGVRVRAFDVDWLQDDALGSAQTDAGGHFRIDYTRADFEKTIFSPAINIELFGGPDIYFKVETLANTPLLVEPPSRGRQPDRENAGSCFCVDLCLPEQPPVDVDPLPVFTAAGGYQYLTDIHSAIPGTGLTLGDGRAFYSTMRLNGILSKKLNGNPMEYRFEVAATNADGSAPGAWSPVGQAQIAKTVIGLWERYAPDFPGDPNPVKTKLYTVNGTAGPGEIVAGFTPDGFVRVPQESNVFGVSGFFQPNGNMMNLISPTLAAFGSVNMAGVTAGNSATSGGHALAQDRHFAIRMMVREQGSAGPGAPAGFCPHIAIDNTGYDNIKHHPSWNNFTDPAGTIGVAILDIAELQVAGCAEITNALTVLFTAAHPNLGAVSITMTGPLGSYGFTLPPAVAGQRFGTAVPQAPPPSPPGFTAGALPACAYFVTLDAQLLLTTGDGGPDDLSDQIAFCKK